MPKKSLYFALLVGIFAGLCLMSLDSEARGRKGGIRVIGSDDVASNPMPGTPQGQGRMNRGKDRAIPRNATACICINWEDGTVFLRGVISEVNEVSLSIIDGALAVDTTEAEIEYMPFVRQCRFVDEESEEDSEIVEIQAGQHVFIQAMIIETENGSILQASKVRVMDVESNICDSNEGGIRGLLDSFDIENGLAVIEGIPVIIDESTVIRTRLQEDEEILPGDIAGAHVVFIDTNEDEIPDSFYAERIMIHRIQSN